MKKGPKVMNSGHYWKYCLLKEKMEKMLHF